MKQILTTSPILAYPDHHKQYYLFMGSSKHSWNGVLVQYDEQEQEDGTKLSVPYPITYQSGAFQGSHKNWSMLTKEAYAIYMSFRKNGFLFKRCTHYDLM